MCSSEIKRTNKMLTIFIIIITQPSPAQPSSARRRRVHTFARRIFLFSFSVRFFPFILFSECSLSHSCTLHSHAAHNLIIFLLNASANAFYFQTLYVIYLQRYKSATISTLNSVRCVAPTLVTAHQGSQDECDGCSPDACEVTRVCLDPPVCRTHITAQYLTYVHKRQNSFWIGNTSRNSYVAFAVRMNGRISVRMHSLLNKNRLRRRKIELSN